MGAAHARRARLGRESLWLSIGAASGLIRLPAADSDRLALATPAAQRAALAAGATPALDSDPSRTLLRAVLNGQCCDVATSSTSHAGDLLRAVRPQHFLALARDNVDSPIFPMGVDHYDETAGDRRNRSTVFARLARLDPRYQKVQRAATFRRGKPAAPPPGRTPPARSPPSTVRAGWQQRSQSSVPHHRAPAPEATSPKAERPAVRVWTTESWSSKHVRRVPRLIGGLATTRPTQMN